MRAHVGECEHVWIFVGELCVSVCLSVSMSGGWWVYNLMGIRAIEESLLPTCTTHLAAICFLLKGKLFQSITCFKKCL